MCLNEGNNSFYQINDNQQQKPRRSKGLPEQLLMREKFSIAGIKYIDARTNTHNDVTCIHVAEQTDGQSTDEGMLRRPQ